MRIKLKLKLAMIHASFKSIKLLSTNTGIVTTNNSLLIFKARKKLNSPQKIFYKLVNLNEINNLTS